MRVEPIIKKSSDDEFPKNPKLPVEIGSYSTNKKYDDKRIDHVLKVKLTEQLVGTIGILFSHAEYLNNMDCVKFMLQKIV